ncbi:MAG: hypothetical protein IID30_11970, partial [Planctomycetes bacterium]|nr:hypothetical protein [Planctomycetota bacterium]
WGFAFDGGGAMLANTCAIRIFDCAFVGNGASANGGALFFNDDSTVSVLNSEFLGNEAVSNGGGMTIFHTVANVANCVFQGNESVNLSGGGFYAGPGSRTSMTASTFHDNRARFRGGGIMVTGTSFELSNSVVWLNRAVLSPIHSSIWAPQNSTSTKVNSSCVRLGWTGIGANNITLDPQFVDADGPDNDKRTFDDNDLRLGADSPCIDTGLTALLLQDEFDLDGDDVIFESLPIDLDSMVRVRNAAVDMGAYESNYCTADFSGDGQVNVTDLLSLLGAWGICQSPCAVDTNGDGQVNVTDLLVLLSGWGTCP